MQLKLTTTALVAAVAGLLGAQTVVAAPRPQATPSEPIYIMYYRR